MVSLESLTRVYWIAYWSHWIAYWIACLSCFCFYHLSVAISGGVKPQSWGRLTIGYLGGPQFEQSTATMGDEAQQVIAVPEQDQPQGNARRRTIAYLDLQVAITTWESTELSLDHIERIENELQAVKVQTRNACETKILNLNLDLRDERPQKRMRCGVKGSVWTDSIFL